MTCESVRRVIENMECRVERYTAEIDAKVYIAEYRRADYSNNSLADS